jgi:probable F420-dependent oxidoreductase
MKLGLGIPQRKGVDLRNDIIEAARTAESAGFSSLWTHERLVFPTEPRDGMYGVPGLPWGKYYEQSPDSLAMLAAAAAVTETVRLGTSVLVAPLYQPVRLAKALATIDQISGGRLVAGLGVGWSSDEARAVGGSMSERGRRVDETLDVFQAVWGPDPVSYEGDTVVLDKAIVLPKPVSRIPVLIGGGSTRALDRIARRADGWTPSGLSPAQVGETWSQIRETAAGYGRDPAAMELIVRANIQVTGDPAGDNRFPFTGNMGQIIDDIVACAQVGADELIVELQLVEPFAGTKHLLDTALEIRERAVAAGI